jgi:hypothetical protein
MKRNRLICVLLLVLMLVFLCTGCSSLDLSEYDNPDVRLRAEAMLDAIIADDCPSAYSLLLKDACTESEFAGVFESMQEYTGNTEQYALNLLYIQTTTSLTNGVNSKTIYATYDMTSNGPHLVVDIGVNENLEIIRFYVTPYEQTDYYLTGTLETMKESNTVQWVFLLLNVIPIGFTIFAFVDCCRQKIRKKVLWLLLLVFGFFAIGFTLSSSSVRINFNLGLASVYTALILYGSGTTMIRFMLPAGAIAYFIARKSQLKKDVPQPPLPELEGDWPPFPPQRPTTEAAETQPEETQDNN